MIGDVTKWAVCVKNHKQFDVTETDQKTPHDDKDRPPSVPTQIGRYRIERLLGRGGFGTVYLAHDAELDRYVAVKVPRSDLVFDENDAEAYLTEARTVANLDHANIVQVHDVGSTDDFPCYIVSKYIEGTNLSQRLKADQYTHRECAELIATVADALHYAHKQGLVHRDVKPGNILIGIDGKPYVADFGLALREEDVGKGPTQAGTASYMSPEQARGEGHRVDGRSDIFSLGIVLYQLLVGRRPFRGDTQIEILDQIIEYEPRPLRQYDEKLPRELERICNRALSKRASDPYTSAHDMAEDLRCFIVEQAANTSYSVTNGHQATGAGFSFPTSNVSVVTSPNGLIASSVVSSIATESGSASESVATRIVPKGLRSFDWQDADFFLELLPGPRDRDGLPDGLRFWKTRVEEMDPDNTFSVGLLYGRSGCGKSSLIKAGLLPRLSDDVIAVYVEATPDETETRLLRGLRKRCPSLPDNQNLKDSLTSLRRGLGVPAGRKVLIIIDQFEQWLHNNNEENTELVQALRQCDGGRVQCLVMVRDDFWMAATRFMRELECRLLEGQNSAAVDLFPIRHAERVLAAFGRAFGTLSNSYSRVTDEQKKFLQQSAKGLAEDGKVVCVRLALFAEMMKGRTWAVDTLKQAGGTKGVGAAFLEENFSTSTAPPEHRYHEIAARKVLNALLPDSGTNIKGAMKSYDELLEVSGYRRRPRDFDDLLQILDSEIRLLTPTDPDGRQDDDESSSRDLATQQYYQLTHDYLVPSMRDWLTRKQKETKRGRAELQLQDRALIWGAKPENRYLPSLVEFCNIRARTDSCNWSTPQREMMSRSGRHHGFRVVCMFVVLTLIATGINHVVQTERERNAVLMVEAATDVLQNSRGSVVPYAINDLREFPRSIVVDELRRRVPESSGRRRLTLGYALSAFGAADSSLLVPEIQNAPAAECANITSALSSDLPGSVAALSASLTATDKSLDWRLKARLSIILLALEDTGGAGEMLRIDQADPEQRTIFIDEFTRWHANMDGLAKILATSSDAPIISGVCSAISRISRDDLVESEPEQWEQLLLTWYVEQPNATIHSSAGLALRNWGIDLPTNTTPGSSQNEPFSWQSTPMGLTMITLPAGDIEVEDEAGSKHAVKLDSVFCICDREVSVRLFHSFISDPGYSGEKPNEWGGEKRRSAQLERIPFSRSAGTTLLCSATG
ncbi:MAG: serine/threonine-protein kinase [Fuerstiella sp.]|nr:serine/threonine-protein kinase [Fuerstiella sp.]